jgi:hypothetical protein
MRIPMQRNEKVEILQQEVTPPRLPRLEVKRQEEQTKNSSSSSELVASMRNQKTRSFREI